MSTTAMVEVSAARLQKLEAMEAKQKMSARRAAVKSLIYVKKAKEQGIIVTKAEVDAFIKEEDARKASEASPAPEA